MINDLCVWSSLGYLNEKPCRTCSIVICFFASYMFVSSQRLYWFELSFSLTWTHHNVYELLNCSQNGKFSYGYASSAGKRSSMEDFFETRIDGIDGEIVGLFGVFDGILGPFLNKNLYIMSQWHFYEGFIYMISNWILIRVAYKKEQKVFMFVFLIVFCRSWWIQSSWVCEASPFQQSYYSS